MAGGIEPRLGLLSGREKQMDPRGGLACHCVLVETGGQNSPTTRTLWIGFTGQLLLNLPNVPFLANRDGLFLALVVRLAMEFKDSTRMHCTSSLASPRRAANSDSAHQYQVVLEGLILRFLSLVYDSVSS